MKVNFVKVSSADSSLEKKILGEIRNILRSGEFVSGKYVQEFEQVFARFLGAKDVIAVNSGTSALHLALLALDLKPGQEVIIPSFTFAATAEAVLYCGATPVFIDIGEDFTLDPAKVEKAITKRTVGMIPVHLFGHMADMEKLLRIAKTHKLWVVEDACQAHGTSFRGKMAGTWGDLGVFSFYPTKNLGGIGEGGAVVTKNKKTAQLLRILRNHGSSIKYRHEMLGYNYRLNEIQAAALVLKLQFLKDWIDHRRSIAHIYTSRLAHLPIVFPVEHLYERHAYHQYTIQTQRRDALGAFLERYGVETKVYYPLPLHRQKVFRTFVSYEQKFPVSNRLARTVLSLPIYPGLSERNLFYITECIRQFYLHHI